MPRMIPYRGAAPPAKPCRINWDSPQAAGLACAVMVVDGLPRDLVSGAVLAAGTAPIVWSGRHSTPVVESVSTTAQGRQVLLPPTAHLTAPPITVCARAEFLGAATNFSYIAGVRFDSGAAAPFVCYGFSVTGAGRLELSWNDGTFRAAAMADYLGVGVVFDLIGVIQSGSQVLYVDTVSQASETRALTTIAHGTADQLVMGEVSTLARQPNIRITDLRVYQRAWDATDRLHFSAPATRWDLYAPV